MNVCSGKNGTKIDISLVCRNHSSIAPNDYTDYVWLRYETELFFSVPFALATTGDILIITMVIFRCVPSIFLFKSRSLWLLSAKH